MNPKYTPDNYGTELAKAITDNEKVDVSDIRGKVRSAMISFTADGAVTAGESIGLAILPEKARIIGDSIQFSAFGAGRTLDLGLFATDGSGKIDDVNDVDDDVDFFLDGIDVENAGADTFARMHEGDTNANYQTQKEVMLVATILGDTLPDAGTIRGRVNYVVD